MAPKLGDRPIVIIEHGGTAEAALDAVDGTIDSMTTSAVFSHCKPNPRRETAEEQRQTNYNFICSQGRNLRPLNNGFVSAWWVSLYLGTDVTYSSVVVLHFREISCWLGERRHSSGKNDPLSSVDLCLVEKVLLEAGSDSDIYRRRCWFYGKGGAENTYTTQPR